MTQYLWILYDDEHSTGHWTTDSAAPGSLDVTPGKLIAPCLYPDNCCCSYVSVTWILASDWSRVIM